MDRRRWTLVLVLMTGCASPTSAELERQVAIEGIRAPVTVVAGNAFPVDLTIRHSDCDRDIRILRVDTPSVVTVEARARYRRVACFDIPSERDTTFVVTAPAPGTLVLRVVAFGSRPALDLPVTITPP